MRCLTSDSLEEGEHGHSAGSGLFEAGADAMQDLRLVEAVRTAQQKRTQHCHRLARLLTTDE